jgi:hypothetical protein
VTAHLKRDGLAVDSTFNNLARIRSSLHAMYQHLTRAKIDLFCSSICGGPKFYCFDRSPEDATRHMAQVIARHFGL